MKNSISYNLVRVVWLKKYLLKHVELSNPTNEATIANEPIDQFLLERYRFWAERKWVGV